MQLTALAILLAAAGVAIATPVPTEPATELTASDLPAGRHLHRQQHRLGCRQ